MLNLKFRKGFLWAFIFLLVECQIINAQDLSFSQLKSEGDIPTFFLNSLNENFSIQKDLYDDFFADKKNLKELKEEVILLSSLNHSFHFKNGLVLFGDDMTNYLNDIKNEILKDDPELRDKITIYSIKSHEVNAFSTLEGQIYFSLGIMSRVNSEAELAFVIGHEIAHFKKNHIINGVAESDEINEVRKKRKTLSLDDIYKLKFKRKKEQEVEADEIGLKYLQNSVYNIDAVQKLLEVLGKAELPIFNEEFKATSFDMDFFKVPRAYTKEKIDPISINYFEDDKYFTHPNIGSRIENVNNLLKDGKKGNGKNFYLKTEIEFKNLKLRSILYQLRANLLARNYIETFYDAESFLQDFPDNRQLIDFKNKALYAIARYKNRNRLHYTTPGYREIRGQSQQLHYMFKIMTSKQVNTLVIKHLFKEYKKDKQPFLDSLLTDLAFDMYYEHDLSLNKFMSKKEAEDAFQKFYSKSWVDTVSTFKKQRSTFKKFYLLALAHEKEDPEFLRIMNVAKKKYDDHVVWNEMDFKKKKKILKQEEKNRITKHDHSAILILSPEYYRYKKDFEKTAKATYNESIEFENKLIEKLKIKNKQIDLLSINKLSKGDVKKYNDFSLATDWINERFSHVSKVNMHPLLDNEIDHSFLRTYDYVTKITIINYKNDRLYYLLKIYDLKTGRIGRYHIRNVKDKSSVNELVREVVEDFEEF